MSEPTEPDSAPETEPGTEPEAEAETETDATAETTTEDGPDAGTGADEPTAFADADADAASDEPTDAAAPETSTGSAAPNNRQLLFIAAALVVALAIGGGLFLIFRGDDGPSAQKQAEKAVSQVLNGYDKVAARDESGCKMIAENIILPPEEADFVTKCEDETGKAGDDLPTKITAIKATKTEIDKDAGTGKVTVDVTTVVEGNSQTSSATLPVRKVDGRWKVDPAAA